MNFFFFCLVGPVRFLTERLGDWTRANAWPLHLQSDPRQAIQFHSEPTPPHARHPPTRQGDRNSLRLYIFPCTYIHACTDICMHVYTFIYLDAHIMTLASLKWTAQLTLATLERKTDGLPWLEPNSIETKESRTCSCSCLDPPLPPPSSSSSSSSWGGLAGKYGRCCGGGLVP